MSTFTYPACILEESPVNIRIILIGLMTKRMNANVSVFVFFFININSNVLVLLQ